MDIPVEITAAISGAIAGGVVSCIFNYVNDRRKERRADFKELQKENQRFFENRPEFKIADCQQFSGTFLNNSRKEELRVVVTKFKDSVEGDFVYANFTEDEKNINDWISVWYKLENVGKTDVSSISLICQDKRHFCLYDDTSADYLMKNRSLHYSACYDNKVRVGEYFEIEVFYHKTHDYLPVLDIGMRDPNGNFWLQPLFIPCKKIGESGKIEYKDFLEAERTVVAEECFKHPWLW